MECRVLEKWVGTRADLRITNSTVWFRNVEDRKWVGEVEERMKGFSDVLVHPE